MQYDEAVESLDFKRGLLVMLETQKNDIDLQIRKTKSEVEQLEAVLTQEMMNDGCVEQDVGNFCLRLRKKPARLEIYDDDAVPDEFMREKVVRSPDKMAIKKWVQAGNATNFAKLVDDEYSLQMKAI